MPKLSTTFTLAGRVKLGPKGGKDSTVADFEFEVPGDEVIDARGRYRVRIARDAISAALAEELSHIANNLPSDGGAR